jgi:hypothetical protein
MTINELKELLDQFLNRWTVDEVKSLKLRDYVGIDNKDTFCQWVETKTRMLGSIKGMTSIKFGIYERKDTKKKPKNYKNDEKYSWLKKCGNDRNAAFEQTKQNVIKTIELAMLGKFEKIDEIDLPDLFKWKVAFLYSNERLIPIYKRDVLFKIAAQYGLQTSRETKISEIQNIMIAHKPANLNVYEFMRQLYTQFGQKADKEIIVVIKKTKKRIVRKAASERNIKPQIRSITRSFIVEQKHNKIQEALKTKLINQFGKENVILEENFVDIKLIQPKYISFYEVKSASFATECIKEALGQILLYSLNDNDQRIKKHFVVGQYPPTEMDEEYINFLKKNLNLEFDYINIDIK